METTVQANVCLPTARATRRRQGKRNRKLPLDSMEAKIDLSVRRVHKHEEELVRFTRLPTSVTHKQRVRDQQEHQTTHRATEGSTVYHKETSSLA